MIESPKTDESINSRITLSVFETIADDCDSLIAIKRRHWRSNHLFLKLTPSGLLLLTHSYLKSYNKTTKKAKTLISLSYDNMGN